MNIEEQERVDAVNRYIMGDKPSNICRETNRSKKWFFKWVNRFKTGDKEWYRSQSRAPKSQGKETCKEIERAVVHGLKVNKRERYKRVKSKKRYTLLNPTKIDEMHQMDWVGPRFIKGYGAISSLNLIDVVSSRVRIEQYNSKSMDNVIAFLIRHWSNNPIPRYLQVDNGMCFIGDFKNPRRFSRFVRLCLYVGIEVVFIAPSSPWMNGSIENFNNWFGSKFWDRDTFSDWEDIRTRSPHFVDQHNDLSAWTERLTMKEVSVS
jgi:IS30 family transposase